MSRLTVKQADLVTRPLWFHKRNLMQTSSGYGGNLKTEYMMYYGHRLHRIYYCCYSNSGTLFIKTKTGDIIIDID
jgi:hypothetical protein